MLLSRDYTPIGWMWLHHHGSSPRLLVDGNGQPVTGGVTVLVGRGATVPAEAWQRDLGRDQCTIHLCVTF
ncbi:hypothetical protein E2C01_020730 [Portunus trituberculatus]|uniref:Uncharacterized protein n=1 Tax=Portunus trituberculatus TaxID=210409 RepID=A0A5B7E2J5_PORTR|nr:hypothetical protein [Portunus trituberculatus]